MKQTQVCGFMMSFAHVDFAGDILGVWYHGCLVIYLLFGW